MGKIKFGRALGLSILGALSMMAIFAVSAQAGEFKVNGTSATTLPATVTGAAEGTTTLLVPGRNLSLSCTGASLANGSIIKGTEGLATVPLTGCTTLSHTTGAELPCTVDNPTATARLLPKLHSGIPFVLVEPDVGTTFTTVRFLGELCPLPEESPVTGSISAQLTTNNAVKDLLTASAAFSALVGDSLKFGGFAGTISAKIEGQLTGAHAGKTFGIG